MNLDPLADFAPELTPYRYSANNPIFFNDPDGLWEFTFDKENNTLNLVKTQESDNWKSFKKQSGLSKGDLKKAFGDDYKDVLDNIQFDDKGGGDESSKIAVQDIGGELGETLQSFEKALGEYNDNLQKSIDNGFGNLEYNNCWGTCESVSKTGKVNEYGAQTDASKFDMFLKDNTKNVSSPKTLDIVRYKLTTPGAIKRNVSSHGSLFLLKNEKGTQMFSKNGSSNRNFYTIIYETEMLKRYPLYGEKAGINRVIQGESGESQTVQDKTAFYRPNN